MAVAARSKTGGVQPAPRHRSSTTRDQVLAQLRTGPSSHVSLVKAMLGELRVRDPDGSLVSGAVDVAQAAELAINQVLDSSVLWVEHIGAFYDTDAVRALLARDGERVTRQAVSKRKGLLALTTVSGRVVYPVMQFRGRQLAPRLDRVLAALPEDLVSRWTVASWLVSPEPELDRDRPIDVLFDGGSTGAVAVVATAQRWRTQLAT